MSVREYKVFACPDCGEERDPDDVEVVDDDGYCSHCLFVLGREVECLVVTAIDERDVEPVVEAAHALVNGISAKRWAALNMALAPFADSEARS